MMHNGRIIKTYSYQMCKQQSADIGCINRTILTIGKPANDWLILYADYYRCIARWHTGQFLLSVDRYWQLMPENCPVCHHCKAAGLFLCLPYLQHVHIEDSDTQFQFNCVWKKPPPPALLNTALLYAPFSVQSSDPNKYNIF